MSKKSKYLWKKIMILTWMFSLFLGILAGPCAIDAKNQKEKKDYGVFLSIDSSQIKSYTDIGWWSLMHSIFLQKISVPCTKRCKSIYLLKCRFHREFSRLL